MKVFYVFTVLTSGDMKPFMKVYERAVLVPRPCYGDRRIIWTHFVSLKLPITECSLVCIFIYLLNFPQIEKYFTIMNDLFDPSKLEF